MESVVNRVLNASTKSMRLFEERCTCIQMNPVNSYHPSPTDLMCYFGEVQENIVCQDMHFICTYFMAMQQQVTQF